MLLQQYGAALQTAVDIASRKNISMPNKSMGCETQVLNLTRNPDLVAGNPNNRSQGFRYDGSTGYF